MKLKTNDLVRNPDRDDSHDYILVQIDMWSVEEWMRHKELVICKDIRSMEKLSEMIKSYKDLCDKAEPFLKYTPRVIDFSPIYNSCMVRLYTSPNYTGMQPFDESGNISFWGRGIAFPQKIGYVNFSNELDFGLRDVYDVAEGDASDYWLYIELQCATENLKNFINKQTKG